MATQIGPKIGIEGEKEYRSAIQQIINQAKTLDSAMQRTASEWDKNTSAMTKDSAVAKNLTQQIELQRNKLTAMNSLLAAAAEKYGENASQTLKWKQAVDNANTSLNQMESKLQSLKGAQFATDWGTKMADMGTKLQNVSQNMVSIGQRLTASVTLPVAAAGAAAVKLASDTEEASNKVDVVFGNMSESVKQFAQDALNSYGMAEGSALQMAGTFGAMATSMGLSGAQAANMSVELTALAADMASFYNVSLDVAQTSLQGVFTGETEALKKFGIVMTQTNLEEFANQQGKVYSKMSEAEKVMTRYAFVMDATKAAQGDFARTSDGTANSLRTFVESLKELGASLGEAILPIITPIIQTLTKMVQAFASLPEPVKKVVVVLALVAAAVGPVLTAMGSLGMAISGLMTGIPALTAAMAGLAPALATISATIGPIILAIVAFVAIMAATIGVCELVYQNWDKISGAASDLGNSIKSAYNNIMAKNDELRENVHSFVSDVVSGFAQLPSKIVEALRNAAQKVKDAFDQMIRNAKESGAHFIEGFVDGIKEKISKVVDAVKKVAKTVQDFLGFSRPDKGPLHEYEEWMPHFMQGLAKGIRSNMGIVKSAMNGVAKEMAIPLSANASMNMAMAGAGAGSASSYVGGTTMNVYVDHISELNDLVRIQNQAQQRYRMGVR